MASPRIITWVAARTSAIPVDSASSDLSLARAVPSQVRSMNLLTLGDNESGEQHANDDAFTRHHKYFFKDGNITFLIESTLYCVHRHFFSKYSTYFSTRLDKLEIHDHEALSIIISLEDVECKDFDGFLSVIYPDAFDNYDLSDEEWEPVLRLSTLWDFASVRELALQMMETPAPFDQLRLARAYSVLDWIEPALSALCERNEPLSVDEARQMSIEDIVLVNTVREDILDDALKVASGEISRRVRAAMRKAAAKVKCKAGADAAERAAKEEEQRMAKTAAAKRKADAEPGDRAADEDVRRMVGKAAKRKVDEEVVKAKHAAEEVAGQR